MLTTFHISRHMSFVVWKSDVIMCVCIRKMYLNRQLREALSVGATGLNLSHKS